MMVLVDVDTCDYCESIDSIVHRFVSCPIVKFFWDDLKCWWEDIHGETLLLTEKDIIFGFYNLKNYTLNNVILYAKYFIHVQKCKGNRLSFYHFRSYLKNKIEIERYVLHSKERPNNWEQIEFVL